MNTSADKIRDKKIDRRGLLGWFAQNHVAANLIMMFMIVAGLFSLAKIKIEIFPELDINFVVVSVPYLGATPEEVEKGICFQVEKSVKEVDGVKRITAYAAEGIGTVAIELDDYTDNRKALDDVKNAVDRITTFPELAEEPVISIATNRTQVQSIALYGDVSRRTLKELSEEIRDDLTSGIAERMTEPTSIFEKVMATVRPNKGISTVTIDGLPPYEISIEVSERQLRQYGLTFYQIAEAVRQGSLDLPAGSVKTLGGEILIRSTGQKYRGHEFEDILVVSRNDGTSIRIGDIATVIDDFEDVDSLARYNGQPAVILNVFRVGEQGALQVADTVKQYIAKKQAMLPHGVHIDSILDRSNILKSRINLLLRNAGIGLFLVFGVLALFLDLRLAFWTTMGIPMSFLGAFILLPIMGVSVNMISLFAFIVVLGIVVDDAIVVGENVFNYRQSGMKAVDAAILGVREMGTPVFIAVMTTIVAFSPLVLSEGVWGQILRVIPIVVISVLLISLVEALLVLPAHLCGGKLGGHGGPIAFIQKHFRKMMDGFIHLIYRPVLLTAIRWRYLTLCIGFAMLMLMGGLVFGHHIKQVFFPEVEADNMVVALTMTQGTPVEQTIAIMEMIEDKGNEVIAEFSKQQPDDAESLRLGTIMIIGSQPSSDQVRKDGGGEPQNKFGSHLGEINMEMLASELRINKKGKTISTTEIMKKWRGLVGDIPGAISLKFTSKLMSSGDKINVELAHRDHETLLKATEKLKNTIASFSGVIDIDDSFVEGKHQVEVIGLTSQGEALGVRTRELSQQVRGAFYGVEAQRIQRGRDEVKVMVRYPYDERVSLADLEDMRVRLADGSEVPFMDVAEIQAGRGFAVIKRTNRKRTVSITADVDESGGANSEIINQNLRESVLPELVKSTPGLTWDMEGEQRERNKSMSSLRSNMVVAILAIYALLAMQFRSYIQPMIIMIAIPFGLVGAVLGHIVVGAMKFILLGGFLDYSFAEAWELGMLKGIPLTFMSFFGIVALTGVVVNDSLIMIDLINRERKAGLPLSQIIENSGIRRFRPIILTTLTTFFGLLPMVLETSLQAQFLIPMAVSISFGVMFATVITLIIVPSLYMIIEDIKRLFGIKYDHTDDSDTEPDIKPVTETATKKSGWLPTSAD